MYTLSFVLNFIQSTIPAYEIILSILKTHLPTSVDVIKVIPQMHAQMPFFQVIVDTVKLTIDMNSPTNHENEY